MYSKLVSFECFNFMSVRHGVCEFDESGIINLKGYNDSGKSAVLTALRVLLCNSTPSKQVDFIQDEQEYFRVMARFDDGVLLLRDKYLNGQSLYEMYKDGQLIFSTKSASGALTSVSKVPDPVANYLGLVSYDGVYLNARSCKEDALGVDTTGSQNYKMFSKVLKSEEIARAGELLNNDRNRLVADINAVDMDISMNRKLLGTTGGITRGLVGGLKGLDAVLDGYLTREDGIHGVKAAHQEYSSVSVPPEVGYMDDVSGLSGVLSARDGLVGLVVTPEVPCVDGVSDLIGLLSARGSLEGVLVTPEVPVSVGLEDLIGLCGVRQELFGLVVTPGIPETAGVTVLSDIVSVAGELGVCDARIAELDAQSCELQAELDVLLSQAEGYVKCPNCGHLFRSGGAHGGICV